MSNLTLLYPLQIVHRKPNVKNYNSMQMSIGLIRTANIRPHCNFQLEVFNVLLTKYYIKSKI